MGEHVPNRDGDICDYFTHDEMRKTYVKCIYEEDKDGDYRRIMFQ